MAEFPLSVLCTASESLDASRQAANSGSVSQKWHVNWSSRSAIQLCSLSANRTAPLVCQGLANEPPLFSRRASNLAQPSDTTMCWGWKLFNKKKKVGLQVESHSAMSGSQMHHRHETWLPFLSCRSSVLYMTQLGWHTETVTGPITCLSASYHWIWDAGDKFLPHFVCKGDDLHESVRQAPLSVLSCSWVTMWHRQGRMILLISAK